MHAPVLHQLLYQFVAQPLDVQRLARGEMYQRLHPLRAAMQPAGAARHCLAFGADDFRVAHRAMRRHRKRHAPRRARFRHGFDDFRDNVASTADENGIADAHVLARYFVGVV